LQTELSLKTAVSPAEIYCQLAKLTCNVGPFNSFNKMQTHTLSMVAG